MQIPSTPPPASPAATRSIHRVPVGYAAPITNPTQRQVAPGARRMPAVARLQPTEFLDVPVWHAPFGRSHHDWPIVELYARLAWRIDEYEADLAEAEPGAR